MSDTVKLVIEIPKEIYTNLLVRYKYQKIGDIGLSEMDKVGIAIKNGTPLDSVIAEIEKLNPVDYGSMFSYESHNGARDMKRDILDILDNIGKEESEG